MSTQSPSIPSPAPSPAPDLSFSSASNAADLKRAHRAAKKAEQNARKEERKRIALETGVDPALLPQALAGDFALNGQDTKGFQPRGWVDVPQRQKRERDDGGVDGKRVEGRKVKIFSWNMLAQALVRRELFPGSDYLKGKDRLPALMQEVTYYSPDIAVLQEVDRLSEHLPSLTRTHGYTSFVGYRNKSHGLIIAHKQNVFSKVGERGIRLDDLPIDDTNSSAAPSRLPTPASGEGERVATPASTETDAEAGAKLQEPAIASADAPDADKTAAPERPKTEKEKEIEARPPDAPSETLRASRRAAGISRVTRNVGLFVALEFKDEPGKGVIVGTTHLFWAGEYVYERTRQVGLLMREAKQFREGKAEWKDWPIFLAGDFNTQPYELTYRLALSPSATVPDALLSDFERSRVVHHSVEKLYNPSFEPPTPAAVEPKEGDNEDFDDPTAVRDKPIKNSRPGSVEEDGIVDLEALRKLFSPDGSGEGVRSAYGEAYGLCEAEQKRWYAERPPGVQAGSGWKKLEPDAEERQVQRREGSWDQRVQRGDFEPIYTNFTPLWRCTLDYIFLLPPSPSATSSYRKPEWRSILQMHDFTDTCEPGLPRKGIEPSDHVAIGAVVEV
ncbi:hypothetical protein JCM11251_001199 [Rhodosporidiobolus azoricus]